MQIDNEKYLQDRMPLQKTTDKCVMMENICEQTDSVIGYSLDIPEYNKQPLENVQNFEGNSEILRSVILSRDISLNSIDNTKDELHSRLQCLSLKNDLDFIESLSFNNDVGTGDLDSRLSLEIKQQCDQLSCFDSDQLLEDVYGYQCNNTLNAQSVSQLFSPDEDGDTHLHLSIIHMLSDISMKIIALAPHRDFLDIKNHLHQTALHLAVATKQIVVARWLVANGALMDACDCYGNTALHIACRDGQLDVVEWLLSCMDHQQIVSQNTVSKLSVPHSLSLQNCNGFTCAHLALLNGHLEVLNLLLIKGADINEVDGKSGRTLLHMAADLGCMRALHLLQASQDLNLNASAYDGHMPVALAQGRSLHGVVQFLQYSGADCSKLNGNTDVSNDDDHEHRHN